MSFLDWLNSDDAVAITGMPVINSTWEARRQKLADLGIQEVDDLTQEVWIPNYTSSNVDAIAYLPVSQTLMVAFRRKYDRPESAQRVYRYPNIPHELYDDLFSSGSPGHTVWERLRWAGAAYERLS